MKKLAVGTAGILAILSLAACAQVGKGKAPPPVVTKGYPFSARLSGWPQP